MSEREQVEVCANCNKPYGEHEIDTTICIGTGTGCRWFPKSIASRLPAPASQPVAQEEAIWVGSREWHQREGMKKALEDAAKLKTLIPSPQAEPVAAQEEEEPLCVICDSPACSLSANGKYYCSQDKPSWQEEEIEVSSETKPSPQAEPSESAGGRKEFEVRFEVIAVVDHADLVQQVADEIGQVQYVVASKRIESQPSTLPQSSPQAQELVIRIKEAQGAASDGDLDKVRVLLESALHLAYIASQPVAEIPQLVSDDELGDAIHVKHGDVAYRLAQELFAYRRADRQRFGKKEK